MRRTAAVATAIAVPALALSIIGVPAALAHDSGGGRVQVVTSHLDNPRGLSFSDGRIWVAESGHGGSLCMPVGGQTSCIGLTAAITRVAGDLEHGRVTVRHVVTGLVSIAGTDGTEASGVADVAVRDSRILAIMAGNTATLPTSVPPAAQPLLAAAKAQLGQLIKANPSGHFRPIAGVGDFDFAWSAQHKNLNPQQFPDSNPNALLPVGDRVYVVDAGANTLDVVTEHGIKVLAFFPVPAGSPTDAVPTCIDRGPDGALYVGELLGGSFAPGHARVWRVVPGHKPRVWATGLTAVNGCGFGPDGNFYAAEFQVNGLNPTGNPAGDVVRIDRHHRLTHLGVGQLTVPSGFTADRHAIYVSNCSIAPATGFGPCTHGGQLVRIAVQRHHH